MKKIFVCVALLSLLFVCGFAEKTVKYDVYGIANYMDGEINIFSIYRDKNLDGIYETAMRDDVAFKAHVSLQQVREIQDNGQYLLINTKTQDYSLISLQDYEIEIIRGEGNEDI